MELLIPVLAFVVVFMGVLLVARRSQRTVSRLSRHEIATVGGASVPTLQPRGTLLGGQPHSGAVGELATKVARREVRTKSAKLLLEAGNPMPLGTYLLLRAILTFVAMPLFVLYIYRAQGLSFIGGVLILFAVVAIPNLATVMVRRKARKRAREIELAMPDALDLLVVCVEGGLSLDGGLQQVAQRSDGVLADEIARMQGEISTGMARREALQALSTRSRAQSLLIFCTTLVQADKMGMSIAATLRTLAETMRTRRRQAAETQARKAPIKMLPFLVVFMIPSLFIIILGPAVIGMIEFFQAMGG